MRFFSPLLFLLLVPVIAFGQSTNPPARSRGNRYLLVIETSQEMQRRTEGLGKSVQELVGSGFGGQARPGDTIGVWTFNDALHSGKLPLQRWTTNSPSGVTNRIMKFLEKQRFEKDPEQTALLKELNGLVKDSEFLTIVFFTTGLEKWNGTPFDRPFNEFIELRGAQQEKARMPFFFALRAQAGSFVEYQTAAPPEPLIMPLLPKELRNPVASGPTGNLIVSGKKPIIPDPSAEIAPSPLTNAAASIAKKSEVETNAAALPTNHSESSDVAFIVDPPRPSNRLASATSTTPFVTASESSTSSNAFVPPPPATVAAQVPPGPRRSILLPVVVILVVFFIFLFWYLFRPPPPVKTSFITRSIDQDK
jgi:hypothetical protein